MYPTIFGGIDSYIFFNNLGTVIGTAVFIFIMCRTTKSFKQVVWNLLVHAVIILSGAKAASILRGLNKNDVIDVVDLLTKYQGSHFLGRVLFAAWMFPIAYMLIKKLTGNRIQLEYEKSLDAISFYFVIQHIFNRIACFCNGCCYGKKYFGPGAVSYQDLESVYPAQLIEAAFMLIILIVLCLRMKKGKALYGLMLVLFGTAIWLSEFFIDQEGATLLIGMSVIQYAAIICMITGYFYIRREQKKNLSGNRAYF